MSTFEKLSCGVLRLIPIFRLTYDATLAELTSLEEMLRIMMEDGQVHHDVINKLWQVYSTLTHLARSALSDAEPTRPGSERPLPRLQRRGAVIILGMLAVARRSVISDSVDVLIKIGLGKLGQVFFIVHPRSLPLITHTGRFDVSPLYVRRAAATKWQC